MSYFSLLYIQVDNASQAASDHTCVKDYRDGGRTQGSRPVAVATYRQINVRKIILYIIRVCVDYLHMAFTSRLFDFNDLISMSMFFSRLLTTPSNMNMNNNKSHVVNDYYYQSIIQQNTKHS